MDVAVVATATLFAGSFIGAGIARAATRSRISEVSADRDSVRAERDNAAAERDRLLGERDIASAERDRLRAERDLANQHLQGASARLVEAQTLLKSQEQVEAQLTESFARMSSETLQTSRQQLLDLADDRFRQAGKPLNETLGKVEAQLREIEQRRASAQAALTEQISFVRMTGEQLRMETAALVGALRKPQTRGQWGELTLRRCLDHAGMLDRSDFVEQASVSTADGTLRPDLVINLVGGKNIVVDAKVTLSAFLDAHEATDDAIREERLTAHAKHLRQHVDALAAKAYWEHLSPTPEFVVLFVPGDAFLAAALERDGALLEDAFRKRVHIATPTTLISVLRTVSYAWQQAALADNAREVFDLGQELYKRLGVFGGHMGKLGRSLASAVNTYNDSVGSLETKVMSTARRLNEMKVVDEALPELGGIDESVRSLTKPELLEADEAERRIRAVSSQSVELDRIEDYGIDAAKPRESEWLTGS